MATTAVTVSDQKRFLEEQRRLAKLWDAFKKQEDEYRAVERERDALWSRVQEMEKDREVIGDVGQARAKIQKFESENETLRSDVGDLGRRLQWAHEEFGKEQERLAKLFKVYQDAESKLQDAWKEIHAWRNWWAKFGSKVAAPAAKAAHRIQRAK